MAMPSSIPDAVQELDRGAWWAPWDHMESMGSMGSHGSMGPCGHKESDMTESLTLSYFHIYVCVCILFYILSHYSLSLDASSISFDSKCSKLCGIQSLSFLKPQLSP